MSISSLCHYVFSTKKLIKHENVWALTPLPRLALFVNIFAGIASNTDYTYTLWRYNVEVHLFVMTEGTKTTLSETLEPSTGPHRCGPMVDRRWTYYEPDTFVKNEPDTKKIDQ